MGLQANRCECCSRVLTYQAFSLQLFVCVQDEAPQVRGHSGANVEAALVGFNPFHRAILHLY